MRVMRVRPRSALPEHGIPVEPERISALGRSSQSPAAYRCGFPSILQYTIGRCGLRSFKRASHQIGPPKAFQKREFARVLETVTRHASTELKRIPAAERAFERTGFDSKFTGPAPDEPNPGPSNRTWSHRRTSWRRGWRREWDSNPRYGFPYTRFPSERLQPLGHPSATGKTGRNIAATPRVTTRPDIVRKGA
jgi:hypothetical protein